MSSTRYEALCAMLGDCADLTEPELRALARELVGRIAARQPNGRYRCSSYAAASTAGLDENVLTDAPDA
jgi:hypothetical protein